MKRLISALAVLTVLLTFTAGCAKKTSDRPYDYDVSEYLEIGQYTGIEYTELELEVTDEDIQYYIEDALSENGYGELIKITDRAIEEGDTVNIDYVGKKDGVAFDGGTASGADLEIGSNTFIDGFESGLVGKKPGTTVNLDLTFPETYGNTELAGAAVVFEVKINYIDGGKKYPDFTDDLVAEISDLKTVEEYRTYATEQLVAENEATIAEQAEYDIWEQITETSTLISYPEGELDYAKDIVKKNLDSMANAYFGVTYEQYLEQYLGMTLEDEEVAEDINQQAEATAKNYLMIVAIAQKENLEVTDEEYDAALESYASQNGYSSVEQFREAIDEKQFYLMLLNEKVTDFIFENAVKK